MNTAKLQRTTAPLSYADATATPRRLPRDIRLADGSQLKLRELRRADREKLSAFFSSCSSEALRYRFMSSIKGLPDSLLNYLADADGSTHVALIVTQGEGNDERIVAEGRYVLDSERRNAADIAFLVSDDMQRRGIATLLLEELTEIARQRGVNCFVADVLADNRAMLSLLRKAVRPLSSTVSHGVISFELSIADEERLADVA